MKIALWIVGGFIVIGAFAYAWIIFAAWYEVRRSPREHMMMCDIHGPLKRSQTVTFVNQPYCALCWFSKFRGTANGR